MLMERGSLPVEYQGKALSEINFDANLEFAEEFIEGKELILFYWFSMADFVNFVTDHVDDTSEANDSKTTVNNDASSSTAPDYNKGIVMIKTIIT